MGHEITHSEPTAAFELTLNPYWPCRHPPQDSSSVEVSRHCWYQRPAKSSFEITLFWHDTVRRWGEASDEELNESISGGGHPMSPKPTSKLPVSPPFTKHAVRPEGQTESSASFVSSNKRA